MHAPVLPQNHLVHHPRHTRQKPCHQPMTPVRRRAVRITGRTPIPTDLRKHRLDKRPRVRDRRTGLAHLGHSRRDQVRLHQLHRDPVLLQLRTQRRRPLLQKRLAARVRRQERRGEQSAERAHGEHQSALALRHPGNDELRGAQRAQTVDRDDIRQFVLGGQGEGRGDAMALADVVDQNCNIESVHEGLQLVVIGVVVAGKVHRQTLRLHGWVLRRDLLFQGGQFRCGAGNKKNIEAGTGELESEFLA